VVSTTFYGGIFGEVGKYVPAISRTSIPDNLESFEVKSVIQG
jgi:hypothetical protein